MMVKLTFKEISLREAQTLCSYARKNKIVHSKDDIDVDLVSPDLVWMIAEEA